VVNAMYRSGMYRCGTLLTRTEVVHVPKWSKFRICRKSCNEVVCTKMVMYRSGPNPFCNCSFATVCHRVMRFSAKCSERNCLHDKGQCLNMAIKYSLFCSWQVNYLKTKLTAKSLRQIRGINKVRAKPTF